MNIGIVGAGSVATAHLRGLQEIGKVSNILLYNRTPIRAEALAKEFSKAHPVESLKVLVENSLGIIIATPNNTHLPILKDILSIKPVPVLCEKPLASNLEEAKAFLKYAHPLSIIGFNYRFNKAVIFIMNLIKRDELGRILKINLSLNRNSAFTKKTMT